MEVTAHTHTQSVTAHMCTRAVTLHADTTNAGRARRMLRCCHGRSPLSSGGVAAGESRPRVAAAAAFQAHLFNTAPMSTSSSSIQRPCLLVAHHQTSQRVTTAAAVAVQVVRRQEKRIRVSPLRPNFKPMYTKQYPCSTDHLLPYLIITCRWCGGRRRVSVCRRCVLVSRLHMHTSSSLPLVSIDHNCCCCCGAGGAAAGEGHPRVAAAAQPRVQAGARPHGAAGGGAAHLLKEEARQGERSLLLKKIKIQKIKKWYVG
jgi:hypothetical protein